MCTLADSSLTKKSSLMVCDTFKVNILLVSPDKKWITAGTRDNDDLSPKVFLVFFDCLLLVLPALGCSCVFCFTLLHLKDTVGKMCSYKNNETLIYIF